MTLETREVQAENIRIALNSVCDTVEDIRRQLDKLMEPEQPAETIQCQESCDNSCDSLAEAVQKGWLDISFDPDGRTWNYLGWCPDCIAEHNAEENRLNGPLPPAPVSGPKENPAEPLSKPKPTGTLFDISHDRP